MYAKLEDEDMKTKYPNKMSNDEMRMLLFHINNNKSYFIYFL